MKVICPCVECQYNGKNYICKAKEIKLVHRNMDTVNEGRVNMWVCKEYSMSKEVTELFDNLKNYFSNGR